MIYVPLIIAAILTNAASLAEAVYDNRDRLGFDFPTLPLVFLKSVV